jgi:hypothetical protein
MLIVKVPSVMFIVSGPSVRLSADIGIVIIPEPFDPIVTVPLKDPFVRSLVDIPDNE